MQRDESECPPAAGARQRSPTMGMMEIPHDSPIRTASLSTAVFNLVSTIVGGGVLSLPFAISVQGIFGGVLALLLCALASDFSIYILVASSRSEGARGYEDVAGAALGKGVRVFVVVLLFSLTFLVAVAYTILCGDLLAALVDQVSGHTILEQESRPYVISGFIVLVAPICFFRKMDALRFTSILSVASVFVLGVVTAYKLGTNGILRPVPFVPTQNSSSTPSPSVLALNSTISSATLSYTANNTIKNNNGLPTLGTILWWPVSFKDAIYAAPIESVAFLCHFNVLPMQDELIQPTRARVKRVTHTTMGICLFLYIAIAVTGYLRFTSSVCGDYLNNFDNNDLIVTIGRVGLLLTLYCSFPLIVLPARRTLSRLLTMCCNGGERQNPQSLDVEDKEGLQDEGVASNILENRRELLNPRHVKPMGSFIADSPYAMGNHYTKVNMNNQAVSDMSFSTLNGTQSGELDDETSDLDERGQEDSMIRHVILTIVLIVGALFLGLKVESVVTIWSIAGSSVAMMIAYVLPAIFYIRLRHGVPFNRRILGAWVMLFSSIILIFLATWQAISQINRPNCPQRGK